MLRLLAHNWELKLASLVIAAALWIFVVGGDRTRVALAAPVEYVGLPDALVLVSSRESVDLEVEAPRWAMERLNPTTLRVRVALADVVEGDSVLQLSPAQVQAPPGVNVTRITPAWVRVSVAAAVTSTVRVVPQIRGAPAAGHFMSRVTVEPSAVAVRGPRSTIEAGGFSLETLPVDVSGRQESVSQAIGLVTPESVALVRERAVQVTVEIQPEDAMQRGGKEPRR
jgi:hypothetical protein